MSNITTIDLLRHGECMGDNIYRGVSDVALTETGKRQMQTAIKSLNDNHWQHIISSPLSRCQDFAQSLAHQRSLQLTIEPRLKEIDFGDWDGHDINEVYRSSPHTVDAFYLDKENPCAPNGEPLNSFKTRVIAALNDMVQRHKGQHILTIQHGGSIRMILCNILNIPTTQSINFSIPYASISRIEIIHSTQYDDFYRVVFTNHSFH